MNKMTPLCGILIITGPYSNNGVGLLVIVTLLSKVFLSTRPLNGTNGQKCNQSNMHAASYNNSSHSGDNSWYSYDTVKITKLLPAVM